MKFINRIWRHFFARDKVPPHQHLLKLKNCSFGIYFIYFRFSRFDFVYFNCKIQYCNIIILVNMLYFSYTQIWPIQIDSFTKKYGLIHLLVSFPTYIAFSFLSISHFLWLVIIYGNNLTGLYFADRHAYTVTKSVNKPLESGRYKNYIIFYFYYRYK